MRRVGLVSEAPGKADEAGGVYHALLGQVSVCVGVVLRYKHLCSDNKPVKLLLDRKLYIRGRQRGKDMFKANMVIR